MTGWTLYTSFVAAPADLFPGEFADIMRIWGSWKVDDRVYLRQMQQTLEEHERNERYFAQRHGTSNARL